MDHEPDQADPREAGSTDPGSTDPGSSDTPTGHIEYDCTPWAQQTRGVLRSLLDDDGIPHAWEGTVLVVPAAFEERVDELVEAARATSRSSLGGALPTVAYEVSGWSAASQNALVDDLVAAHIPHEWDSEGDLVVHEEDTEAVEELIDALGEPDGADEIDGITLNERLSELFVMADRLARDGEDTKGRKGVASAYGELATAAVPFGVEPAMWLRLHRAADELLESIDRDEGAFDEGRFEEVPDERAGDGGPGDGGSVDGGPGDDGPDATASGEGGGVAERAVVLRDLLRRFV